MSCREKGKWFKQMLYSFYKINIYLAQQSVIYVIGITVSIDDILVCCICEPYIIIFDLQTILILRKISGDMSFSD